MWMSRQPRRDKSGRFAPSSRRWLLGVVGILFCAGLVLLQQVPRPVKPPSLFSLFATETQPRSGLALRGYISIKIAKDPKTNTEVALFVPEIVYYDLKTNVKYVTFYVPHSDKPTVAMNTLAGDYAGILKAADRAASADFKEAGWADPTDEKMARFSGTVYVYHEDLLRISEQEGILKAFKVHGASAVLRGPDYVTDVYEAMRAGDVTPTPMYSFQPPQTVDCQGRHFESLPVLPHSSVTLLCQKPMVVPIPKNARL